MKILIAMSGGVDSAVTAYLLKKTGAECIGATMRLCGVTCGSEENVRDARAVAESMGMGFLTVDYTELFGQTVVSPFVSVYERGGTPNPCINCNRFLKFGALYDAAMRLGATHIATGHYARIEERCGRFLLKKAADPTKDQSYVLYHLTQEQLSHTLFPLGGMTKDEVRATAKEQGLSVAHKKESQDICFIPDGDYAAYIRRTTGKLYPPGEFVNRAGEVLGTHKGIIHYTVGQRRGLGLALSEPHYVCEKDAERNRVVLCTAKELPSKELTVKDFHWISGETPVSPIRAAVRTRYHQKEQPAVLYPQSDGRVRIVFDTPEKAAAPGQAAVAYDGDTVLGGGEIC